ncbi:MULTISPECIES: type III-B CRISPR-associated protein Cas10/Cmr2 [Marinomonas]|uniref:Type III-B CRISPR-associated protein Cas10/Cmr2 n=1 Tax=Marinomonas arctica TaxID=383750 RepID=A0A7H1J9Z6_9GAMM|nr:MULTISPECIES: type III-B CRISPR-associated protein Cas10/Cmr2 [Marinomonas]MCS7488550.1 CRISPR-associated protein Crm2 [Marinomonas sp. BSi20414]QNT07312.1 type III-B CRISPR-associated protein Cas10/Cmr2 [Marinomonas arctica]GGN27620.1 type III-B CRISPR-associated protein Cas10/Cmr2 [Marinomonas arctica]
MEYLVAISIGPVQSLIEAGRRAQDLWCGSWLLSEVARAVALNLHQTQKGCLIFPNPENPDIELQPQSENDMPKANIANVIRVVLTADSETELKQKIDLAKTAAFERLKGIFTAVLNEDELQNSGIDRERWQQQQGDVLEIFSAWVSLANHDYKSASKRLAQLLQARKLTRNFDPIQDNGKGLHKSTLDGANNTVTNKLTARDAAKNLQIENQELVQKKRFLGLNNEEELDALGVVKRRAGNLEQFTPFSRIVAHSWLDKLSAEDLNALRDAYEPLLESGHVTKVSGNDGVYKGFPFDGEYLFLSRVEQADIEEKAKENLQKQLEDIKSFPVPYGVLLKADGDRMGELLAQANTPDESIKISKALHEFATSARKIVQLHGGHAIYAGGDDVLAFVPLAQAMTCAKQLAYDFKEKMKLIAAELKLNEALYPTLSVGLAIGHFVQPMRQLRQRAVAAEKHAKGNAEKAPRNALAIHLGIRSGHEITWRCRWDDEETLKALSDFAHAFAKGWMPTRIMQEVREMALRLQWTYREEADLSGVRTSELERMLSRADFAVDLEETDELEGKTKKECEGEIINSLKSQLRLQASRHTLDEFANQLVLARWLSAKTTTDIGGAE